MCVFFFSSRRRHTRWNCDWSSDVCSSDLGAAHDAADANGAGAVTIADHADAGVEGTLDAVEGPDFFGWLGAADHNAMVTHFVVVEGVDRMSEFEHHVIAHVDDVVDAGYAGSFEAVLEPFRRGLNFHAANYTSGEAAAELGRLNLDAHRVAGFCGGAFVRLGGNRL